MPDFAKRKPAIKDDAKPRPLVGFGEIKPPVGDKPAASFRALLKDFAGGIRALNAALSQRQTTVGQPVPLLHEKISALTPVALGREQVRVVNTTSSTHRDSTRVQQSSAVHSNVRTQNSKELRADTHVQRTHEKHLSDREQKTHENRFSDREQKTRTHAQTRTRQVERHESQRSSKKENLASREMSTLLERLRERAHFSRLQTQSLAGLNIPVAQLPASVTRRMRGRFQPVTGADREAVRQVLEPHQGGSPHHVPAPARLAQILHADRLVQRGEGRVSGELAALAQAIREGRRRDVADLDPERVQAILNSALGGQTRAQQLLSTPVAQRLIERHTTRINTVQATLREQRQREKVFSEGKYPGVIAEGRRRAAPSAAGAAYDAGRAIVAPSVPYGTGRAGVPANENARVHNAMPGQSDVIGERPLAAGDEAYEPQLAHMAATNDDMHVGAVAASEQSAQNSVMPYRDSDRVLAGHSGMAGSGGGGGSSGGGGLMAAGGGGSGGRPPGTSAPRSSERSAAPAAGSSAVMDFSSPTPSGRAAQALSQAMGGQKHDRKKELSGKLKLIGSSGQPLGEALIEGDM